MGDLHNKGDGTVVPMRGGGYVTVSDESWRSFIGHRFRFEIKKKLPIELNKGPEHNQYIHRI